MFMAGTRVRELEPCSWCLTSMRLYDNDILVKLLGDRFDPASCVSASRSRFHGYGVIMKMQILLLMLSQNCVVSATHRARRNFAMN